MLPHFPPQVTAAMGPAHLLLLDNTWYGVHEGNVNCMCPSGSMEIEPLQAWIWTCLSKTAQETNRQTSFARGRSP
jgi:hypothetical protein